MPVALAVDVPFALLHAPASADYTGGRRPNWASDLPVERADGTPGTTRSGHRAMLARGVHRSDGAPPGAPAGRSRPSSGGRLARAPFDVDRTTQAYADTRRMALFRYRNYPTRHWGGPSLPSLVEAMPV